MCNLITQLDSGSNFILKKLKEYIVATGIKDIVKDIKDILKVLKILVKTNVYR